MKKHSDKIKSIKKKQQVTDAICDQIYDGINRISFKRSLLRLKVNYEAKHETVSR